MHAFYLWDALGYAVMYANETHSLLRGRVGQVQRLFQDLNQRHATQFAIYPRDTIDELRKKGEEGRGKERSKKKKGKVPCSNYEG